MTPIAMVTASVACSLLLLTAISQTRQVTWIRRLKAWDPIAALPTWTFFAPNPGVTDTRIVWRDQHVNGSLGLWHELAPPEQGLLRAVWRPGKRAAKGIVDCCSMVLRSHANHLDSPLPLVSLPYLLPANHVCSAPSSASSTARQFAILATRETDVSDPQYFQVHMVSHWIRLPGMPADLPLTHTSLPEAS